MVIEKPGKRVGQWAERSPRAADGTSAKLGQPGPRTRQEPLEGARQPYGKIRELIPEKGAKW